MVHKMKKFKQYSNLNNINFAKLILMHVNILYILESKFLGKLQNQ